MPEFNLPDEIKYDPREIHRLLNEMQIRLRLLAHASHPSADGKQRIKDADTIQRLCTLFLSFEASLRNAGGLAGVVRHIQLGGVLVTGDAMKDLLQRQRRIEWEHIHMRKMLLERFEIDVDAELEAIATANEAKNRGNGQQEQAEEPDDE